ncbi:MAG: preprotein translocase subunit SecY [Deltaproteobacteria bacterium]|nr:preprotein translocase subunit SecY [Deltaproteobacteria bacterium]
MIAGGVQNIFKVPELWSRIKFVLFALAVYRIGCFVPTPGIDGQALASFFEQAKGTLLGVFNMFSGGALERLSVFALGIMPYISASIIFQLLTVLVPSFEALKKEGESGRKKITQYTRYGTILISIVQGFGIAVGLEAMQGPAGEAVVLIPGWGFRIVTVITLTAGTAFLMWLGEQMTEKGIGNGISLIIFAGIVARLPAAITNTFQMLKRGDLGPLTVAIILLIMFVVIAFILYFEKGQRRIPISHGRKVVGMTASGSHLPLKVNTAGVIPPIFASSLLLFPATLEGIIAYDWMSTLVGMLGPEKILYNVIFVALIIFFCFFYTAVTFNPEDIADNLKKSGSYIPGIRPGKSTAEYIDLVLSRITLGGALYVAAVCVLPTLLIARFNVPFYFGGTALLIVVSVGIDTAQQIESHLLAREYEGFMKSGRIRGRR